VKQKVCAAKCASRPVAVAANCLSVKNEHTVGHVLVERI
jgi:hypothetical protein